MDTFEHDPHLWLEDIYGEKPLDWVRERNQKTFTELKQEPLFSRLFGEGRDILLSQDRIPYVQERGKWLYNFWQDETHVRGIWRRTTLESYREQNILWETVLDLDQLARDENENWVFHGVYCLRPSYKRCMIALSRGGKDAHVLREFDLEKKSFVEGGFAIPEAKSSVVWLNSDTLLLGYDFGPSSVTKSGYPRTLRVLSRGQKLDEANVIFEGAESDVYVYAHQFEDQGQVRTIVFRGASFYTAELFVLNGDRANGYSVAQIPVPDFADISTYFRGRLYFSIRKNWTLGSNSYQAGSILSLSLRTLSLDSVELVWAPTASSSALQVFSSQNHLFLLTQEDVKARLWKLATGTYVPKAIPIPDFGTASVIVASEEHDVIFLNFQSFLVPSSLLEIDATSETITVKTLKAYSSKFNESDFKIEQFFVKTKDGERIPYFVVHSKAMALDGQNPTLMTAYGGFEISRTPTYLGVTGKSWLERGGVFVLANIRGGGEYGPRWHQAVLKENRQKAFDDFIAVAEDLFKRKITSPAKLGIKGGSNGGLLMGAIFTQRPDLAKAVICQVPLLDMLRFHKLLAGHSWTAEYGDPDVAHERETLKKYSPYQNLKRHLDYPKVFFVTSTADDRVHPGHARKMVARLEEYNKDYLYFENIEGGHSASANLEQAAHELALEFSYLFQMLK